MSVSVVLFRRLTCSQISRELVPVSFVTDFKQINCTCQSTHGRMYSTRRVNSRIVDGNAYISIGDPYKDLKVALPERWKGKALRVPKNPINAENGYFTKVEYKSCPYEEVEKYSKTQPNRKLGFGTKDAFKSNEFAATIRTEQYRSQLKKEQEIMNKYYDNEKNGAIIKQHDDDMKKNRTFCEGLSEIMHQYDVGRTQVTQFDPKSTRDRFYNLKKERNKRLGDVKPMSCDIGDGAWSYKYRSPEFGPIHCTKQFWDKSHLVVDGP